jgi:uncharacterized LabA/DUF88 family protein
MTKLRTYIYIDGFNFYYRSLKDTNYKWLDFKKLFTSLLGLQNQIIKIKYFTTMVSGKYDPEKPNRQLNYIRALERYTPEISIYFGMFLSHTVKMPLADSKEFKLVSVIKAEEKGSDVNLAVHLLNDAWLDVYDCAVILSNDSDLSEAIRLVKEQRKKIIGIVTPVDRPSVELIKYADFTKRIRKHILEASQLPNPIPGTKIFKPETW